jgi:tetratricopeptide (TPR) repeat protein
MLDPRGQLDEGLRFHKVGMLGKAIEYYEATAGGSDDPAVVAEAFCRAADAYRVWCKWDRGIEAARHAAGVAREAGLDALHAEALNAEAAVYLERGELNAAEPLLRRILDLTSDRRMRGIALQNLGSIAAQRADLRSAEDYFRRSYRTFRRAGYRWGEAFALNNFAAVALDMGRLKLALDLGLRAMEAAQRIGDFELLGIATMNAAEAHAAKGEVALGEALATTALGYFAAEDNAMRRAQCLRVLGDISVLKGDRLIASRFYEQALELAEALDSPFEASRLRDCLEVARARA